MAKETNDLLLKYGIPSLAVIVIFIQLVFVNTQKLNKWKGGGYGMYTEIHFYYHQIYIPGMSVDSLVTTDTELKKSFSYLMLMPNRKNLKKAGELVLEKTQKDSIQIQVWKPTVSSETGRYSRVLIDEIHLKNKDL